MSRILIVDDEESIRRSLAGILSDEGFETDTVADGEIALTALRTGEEVPDLVLLDIAMPGRDGVGISPGDRRRIFEPYFSTKDHGSGLGLAIVSRIIADHHGYIRVHGNRPRGTRFIVELPVRSI